jgi:hypothetical protein
MIANPGEINVVQNLRIFADLRPGDRLIPPDGVGFFAIHRAGSRSEEEAEMCDDAVMNDRQFLIPVTEVFRTADRLKRSTTGRSLAVSEQEMQGALAGLRTLKETYAALWQRSRADDPFPQRDKVDKLFSEVTEILRQGGSEEGGVLESTLQFVRKYEEHLVFKVFQRQHYSSAEKGICQAFCWDWLRRKILTGKDSYAISKRTEAGKAHRPGDSLRDQPLPRSGRDRLQGKVDKALHDIQDTYRRINGVRHTHVKFAGLDVEHVLTGPEGYTLGGHREDGNRAFYDMLLGCAKLLQKEQIPSGQFEIILRGKDVGDGKDIAHAMALDLNEQRIHFFDPNFGEFEFGARHELQAYHDFGGELLEQYWRGGSRYTFFSVARYFRNEEQVGPVNPHVLEYSRNKHDK